MCSPTEGDVRVSSESACPSLDHDHGSEDHGVARAASLASASEHVLTSSASRVSLACAVVQDRFAQDTQ